MDKLFTRIASLISGAAGRPATFVLALGIIIVWAVSGPLFGYSDTWQLVINTGTTIVTFLMVFLIQNSQNRDAGAMQAKLDELLRAIDTRASVPLITKPAAGRNLPGAAGEIFALTADAHDLYVLGCPAREERRCGGDWRASPFVL